MEKDGVVNPKSKKKEKEKKRKKKRKKEKKKKKKAKRKIKPKTKEEKKKKGKKEIGRMTTEYFEIIRKLNVSNANELWVRPFVNAYYYKEKAGVGIYKNVAKNTVYENADEVETRDLDVETRLVTLRPGTKPVVCTVFKLSFVFGHFHVITEHGKRVIARYTSFGKNRTLVALNDEDREQLLAIARSRREKWAANPMYVIRKSGLRELHRPPLVNLWVLDKKTMRLTNYYKKYDEDVLEKSIKFSSVAEFAEEADTSQEPVRILNREALSSMGRNLQYFVQCVHQLKDKEERRLVTLSNTDEPRYGNVMGWMNELSKRTKSRYNKIREKRRNRGNKSHGAQARRGRPCPRAREAKSQAYLG